MEKISKFIEFLKKFIKKIYWNRMATYNLHIIGVEKQE